MFGAIWFPEIELHIMFMSNSYIISSVRTLVMYFVLWCNLSAFVLLQVYSMWVNDSLNVITFNLASARDLESLIEALIEVVLSSYVRQISVKTQKADTYSCR